MSIRLAAAQSVVVLSFLLSGVLIAQQPIGMHSGPLNNDLGRFDIAFGFSKQRLQDANGEPQCEHIGAPCFINAGAIRAGREDSGISNLGFVVQGARHLNASFALVGEGSFYRNIFASYTNRLVRNDVAAMLVGVRASHSIWYSDSRDLSILRVFASAVTGPEHASQVSTRIAVQPGAGIEFRATKAATFRAEFDHRFTRGGPWNLSSDRFVLGVAIGHM